MLDIKNLTVSYGEGPVFKDLSVQVVPGKITGIIGPNGAGKSTLIKAILGLIKRQAGTSQYDGQPLQKIQKQIAYVEQRKDIDLTFPINVSDVVLTGSYAHLGLFKNPGKAEKQAALDALDQVRMRDFAKRQIGNLSGGQLQRVFIARAILQQAKIVILDEPFVGIDLQSERTIMNILKQWRAQNKIILVVHHDLNKVSSYFDDLIIMNHGIVDSGPTKQVYNAQNMAKTFSADLSAVLFEKEEQR